MAQENSVSSQSASGDILIIDDTPVTLRILSRMLESAGYQVRVAQDSRQGVAMAELTSPDLILLDILMPEMDGFEVCRRLKSDPRKRDIPVIFLSASTSIENKIEAFNVGGVDYITKPVEELELSVRVRTQLERVRAERALRKREESYRHLLEAMFEGLLLHDNGRIIEINSRLSLMTGYSPDEMIGHSVQEFVAPSYWPEVAQKLARGGITHLEIRLIHKSGTPVDVEILGHPFFYLGERVRVVAVRDITERKRAEQHAFSLAVEKERVQILSNFITQASHEFRTPLTNIELRASLLGQVTDPDKRRQYLREIKDQVAGLNDLLSAMLLMTRLDGGVELDFAPVNMAALLQITCANLEEIAEKNELRLAVEIEDHLPTIEANRSLLQTAITNLLENALRFTPPGGTVQLRGTLGEGQIVVEVRDTGGGMTHEQVRRIFERFYRADEAHSTRGFGLGLPIAQKIIELHGGQIEVQSQIGSGSVFTVRIPIVLPPAPSVPAFG